MRSVAVRAVGGALAACALLAGCGPGNRALPEGGVDVVRRAPDPRLREDLVTLRSVYENVRFDGEYGLMVRETDGALEVHWITRETSPGILRIFAGDSALHEIRTPPHLAHGASFARPDAATVRAQYGSLETRDDLHETVIDLEGPRPAPRVLPAVDSLFAVGDVHGEYANLTDLLYNAGLLDEDLNWYGGRAHVVLLGDLFDRGSDVTKTLWFVYGLERQARRAGGGVHVLLGNHETMVFTGDLRYVSTKERMIPEFFETTYPGLFDIRTTVLGRWLASRPGMMRIGDYLLAHGGVSPAYASYSVEEFNDSLAAYLSEDLFYRWADSTYAPRIDSAAYQRRYDFFFSDESVFWFRGYVTTDTLGPALDRVLARHESRTHVVAHTPVRPVQSRYDGRLVAVDLRDPATGMLFVERTSEGERRWLYGLRGGPEPLPEGSARRRTGGR